MHFVRFSCVGLLGLLVLACQSSDDPGPEDGGGGSGGSQAGSGGASGSGGMPSAGTGGSPSAGTGGGGSAGSTTGGSASGTGGTGTSGGGSAGGGAGSSAGTGGGGASAGSGTDAGAGGTIGGTGAAGGGAGTSSADPCATALFCDDFESYTTGQAPGGKWTRRTNNGSVTVDETQHVSGTKAAKFTTTGTSSSKTAFLRMLDASVFPVPNNTFYGRMLFYLESAPTSSVHWTFVQGSGLIAGQTYRAQYRYGGQQPVGDGNQLMANYETPDSYGGNGPSTDCWHHANGKAVPTGRWACAEWKFDGANNEMRFWLDGAAVEDLTVIGTGQGCVSQAADYPWTAPNFSELEIGWESYQTDSDRTLYIDDVVISTTAIGCPE
jgi:hypothetical protein